MKKAVKKLRLSKETLRELDTLEEVVGGVTIALCNSDLCTRTCTGSFNTCTSYLC
jgi:hypothetical protein